MPTAQSRWAPYTSQLELAVELEPARVLCRFRHALRVPQKNR